MTDEQKQELCLKCHKCCEQLLFEIYMPPIHELAMDVRNFYEARGCTVFTLEQGNFVTVPLSCPHLTKRGCAIYEDRPVACRMYDGTKSPTLADECLWNSSVNMEK
jgi:Fe-S-cluster containining protein